MNRILLALGYQELEEYLKKSVKNCYFVGAVSYREGVLNNCINLKPDILIIRETLPGAISITDLIYSLRTNCFNTRIIFLSKEREIGDSLLSELVSLGVYDIVATNPIEIKKVISLISKPNTYNDVSFYRKKIVIDESKKQMDFVAPKQIVKTVYVEKENSNNNSSSETEAAENNFDGNKNVETVDVQDDEFINGDFNSKGDTSISNDSGSKTDHTPNSYDEELIAEKLIDFDDGVDDDFLQETTPISSIPYGADNGYLESSVPDLRFLNGSYNENNNTDEKLDDGKNNLNSTKKRKVRKLADKASDEKITKINEKKSKSSWFLNKKGKQGNVDDIKKTKIISILNSHPGVGSTQVSFNIATELAKTYKTLYVEVSKNNYSIGNVFLLEGAKSANCYKDIYELDNYIYKKDVLIDKKGRKNDVTKNYKYIPDKLNLLFLPLDFKNNLNSQQKDLVINLTLKLDYEIIIFDLGSNDISEVMPLLSSSNIISIVSTQDFNYISESNKLIKVLNSELKSPDINLIINRYDKNLDINTKKIENYCDSKIWGKIPYSKDFLQSNYLGIATVINSKDSVLVNSILTLSANYINYKN